MRLATVAEVDAVHLAVQLRQPLPHRLVGARGAVVLETIPIEIIMAEMTIAMAAAAPLRITQQALDKAHATLDAWNTELDAIGDRVAALADPQA